jgi:hypothetical protein
MPIPLPVPGWFPRRLPQLRPPPDPPRVGFLPHPLVLRYPPRWHAGLQVLTRLPGPKTARVIPSTRFPGRAVVHRGLVVLRLAPSNARSVRPLRTLVTGTPLPAAYLDRRRCVVRPTWVPRGGGKGNWHPAVFIL